MALGGLFAIVFAGRVAAASAAATSLTVTSPPVVDQPPQVGVGDSCGPGSFSTTSGGTVTDTDYTWFRDTTGTPVYESHDGRLSGYTPVAADLGHRLICRETVTDSGNATSTTADSSPSAPTAPTAAVTLTRYQPAVSGSLGESVAGVTVTLGLVRPSADGSRSATVAQATATTAPNGTWSATLASPAGAPPDAFGAPGDELTTAYAAPVGSPGALLPGPLTYTNDGSFALGAGFFAGDGSAIAGDGTAIADADITGTDCSALTFLVNGSPVASSAADGDPCTARPGTPVGDGDHVQAALTGSLSDGTTTGTLTTISDVGLVGTGASGPPACTADLVTADVACTGLGGGAFTVSRNGGQPVALASSPGYPGASVESGNATLAGLRSGDVVTLRETGPSAPRALTSLHVAGLRIDLDASGGESGTCDSGKAFGGGAVCPVGGSFDAALGADTALFDDLSGSETQVTLPGLRIVSPADGDSVPSGGFPAVASVSGDGTVAQTDAQALAETSRVTLTLARQGSSAPATVRTLALGVGQQGPEAQAQITGLSQGGYNASWLLTDVHGDSATVTDTFGVHPGAAIFTTGPSPVVGHGRVPRWLTALAGCLLRRVGKRPHSQAGCTSSIPARGDRTVSIRLTRSALIVATGLARVHRRVARVHVRVLRTIIPGRYGLIARFVSRRRSMARRWTLAL